MNVLVLNGSPKREKSNTLCLTQAFLDGAGWDTPEFVDVAERDIKPCHGCFACWNKTPGKCVIRDSMDDILSKITTADVIIWSFPLYYFGVPGALKNLIDRQLPLNFPFMAEGNESGGHLSRYDLGNQKHVVISTCGFWTAKGNYESVTSMFDHFCIENHYTSIFCGQGELFRVPELKDETDAYLELVHRAGMEYVAGEISTKTQESLSEPMFPRDVFEKMADASWGITKESKDLSTEEESLQFTKKMAALYRPDGVERVLEFYYTDIEKTYQVLLTKEGSKVISEDFRPYTTQIETVYSVWRSIARGEIAGQDALFQRLYKVSGDFNLMLQWDQLFGTGNKPKKVEEKQEKQQKKTKMLLLLMPWIVIWIAIAIQPTIGAVLGIICATSIPIFWNEFQSVVYERMSIPLVTALSLAVIFGGDIKLIVSGSYLVFGLMWFIGAFPKIPLTANYSAMEYGGEKAFTNQLFIKTNRILTATWGVLYIITPIWTYILMGKEFSSYVGLINSILPALMGVFTKWFQKWYPAQYAKGKIS